MSDFSAEDLFEQIDRAVARLLELYGVPEPPVDAVALAQEAFEIPVREAEPEDDEVEQGRFGPRPRRFRSRREIVFLPDQSDEGRNLVCARACARALIPPILEKLGVTPGTENRAGANQLVTLIAPRLLLPTRWFERDARKAGHDLWALKDRYRTATYEMIGGRMLDGEEPCFIAVVDDGAVASRRGNRAPATRTLTAAETLCLERVAAEGEPQKVRRDDWTAQGWPVPNGPFNRILLRAVPDEL